MGAFTASDFTYCFLGRENVIDPTNPILPGFVMTDLGGKTKLMLKHPMLRFF